VTPLLEFLVRWMGFLWDGDFHLVSSVGGAHSDAYVVAQSNGLRLRISRDRGQLFLDYAPRHAPDEWFDGQLVEAMLTGRLPDKGLLGPDHARFLQESLPRIVTSFAETEWPSTKEKLARLGRLRADGNYGPLP
jgi:hypothetical protein